MNGIERVEAFPTPKFLSFDGGAEFMPDLSAILPAIFTIIFLVWLAYTAVAAYHWIRYGPASLAIPVLAAHVFVSGTLMTLALAGLA